MIPNLAPVVLDGSALDLAAVERVARFGAPVELAPGALETVDRSRRALEQAIAGGEVIYGVNTGFGSLAKQRLSGDELRAVQRNIILSHASGVGAPLPDEVVRGMLLCLAASLVRGLSGVRGCVLSAV